MLLLVYRKTGPSGGYGGWAWHWTHGPQQTSNTWRKSKPEYGTWDICLPVKGKGMQQLHTADGLYNDQCWCIFLNNISLCSESLMGSLWELVQFVYKIYSDGLGLMNLTTCGYMSYRADKNLSWILLGFHSCLWDKFVSWSYCWYGLSLKCGRLVHWTG